MEGPQQHLHAAPDRESPDDAVADEPDLCRGEHANQRHRRPSSDIGTSAALPLERVQRFDGQQEVDLLAFKRTREWERRPEVEPPPCTLVVMRPLALAALLALALAGALPGCSTSPAEQDAIRRTWAERDAERAAECQRRGVGFVAGGCATGGP